MALILLSATSVVKSEDRCHDAITRHLSEAIIYNKSVITRYAELSDEKSRPLSLSLIALENISKILVKKMEKEASLYRDNGIPLLCEELGDMQSLPTFKDLFPQSLWPVKYYKYDYLQLSQNLKKLMKANKINESYQLIADDLLKLENFPYQECLTRHFLESMARTLKLSQTHRDDAKNLGLADPLFIIKKFINIQRNALVLTNFLDRKAFPLQQAGIMIYCQDIPPINWK